jgi:phosphopantothenoylcysteine decarboxylase/phosphopantothenate--cysteine ligase
MTILVTAGASREPIDAVRFLSNIGTGATGAAVADGLAARGHRIALLRGQGSVAPVAVTDSEIFSSAEDLRARLSRRLAAGEFEAVVMTAAVADYRPQQERAGKMSSDSEILSLRLVRNPKLLPALKSLSRRPLIVTGFKLTVGADAAARRAAVAAQFAAGGIDLVVHNDLEDIRRATAHPFWIYRSTQAPPTGVEGAAALAVALEAEFNHRLPAAPESPTASPTVAPPPGFLPRGSATRLGKLR